jgi:HPt (histidine-containing phosphotransfer) domain-containing protein
VPALGGRRLLDEVVVAELESLRGEVLTELISLYFSEVPWQMAELSRAVGRGETLAIEQVAHRLSGGSCTVGAAQVSDIAAELEATARAGDLTNADHLIERLRRALDETQTAFTIRLIERKP